MPDAEVRDEAETACDCGRCHCKICAAALLSNECACCTHGCSCCGHKTSEVTCGCEDDCGCSAENCNCKHGPCDSEPCTCACGCGGNGDAHVCPVCGMTLRGDGECACVLHHHQCTQCGSRWGHCGGTAHAPYRRPPTAVLVGLGLLSAVDLALKTAALRRAVKLDDKGWVLPLAVVNTVGLLPAYYLGTHPEK